MVDFSVVMDLIRDNEDVFDYITKHVLLNPTGIYLYRVFYPRAEKSMYTFFLENESVQKPFYTESLYVVLKDSDDFCLEEFMKLMIARVPTWMGFDAADAFMESFKSHLQELSIDAIKEVLQKYKRNPQCTNRARHSVDMDELNEYIANHQDDSN